MPTIIRRNRPQASSHTSSILILREQLLDSFLGRMATSCGNFVRRILIFRYGQLGDTLVALPALWALREHFADAHLTLLSEQPHRSHISPDRILPHQGLFDEFWTFPTAHSGRSLLDILKLATAIRRRRFDALVYLAPRLRGAPQAVRRDLWFFRILSGIDRIIGHTGAPPIPDWVPGQPLPVVVSEAESLLARLAAAGIPVPAAGCGRIDLALTLAEREQAQRWWQNAGAGEWHRSRAVAMGVGAKWPSKLWPEERFAALGRRLITELGVLPVIFGGPEDRALGERLVAGWGGGLVAAGHLGVREAAALMEGMAGYVGNDTGAMHLAAAAGLRCVGIFSAQDWPGRWVPYGQGHVLLRRRVPCEGCLQEVCDRDMACLNGIQVEDAMLACRRVYRQQPLERRAIRCAG